MTVHRASLTVKSVEDYFATVLAKRFRWEPDQGPAAGEPRSPAVVWSPVVLELMEALEDVTLHSPAPDLCREMGYHAGLESAAALDRARDPNLPKAETLLAMPPILAGTGFGTSELVYDDQRERLVWIFDLGTAIALAVARTGRIRSPRAPSSKVYARGGPRGVWGSISVSRKRIALPEETGPAGSNRGCFRDSRSLDSSTGLRRPRYD